jgi:hypothetical protein
MSRFYAGIDLVWSIYSIDLCEGLVHEHAGSYAACR